MSLEKHKSPHRITDASSLHYGQPIIVEYEGEIQMATCLGFWLAQKERTQFVKTDLVKDGFRRVDLPLEKVWLIRDSRDDEIESLKAEKA